MSRVNCLACQCKLAQELAYAVETANTWQAVLLGMAERCNRPRQVLEVSVVGSDRPLTYRLDDQVTKAF